MGEQDSTSAEPPIQPAPASGPRAEARRTRPRLLLVTSSWADIANLRLLLGPMAEITVALNAEDAKSSLASAELDVVLWDLDLGSSTPVASLAGIPEGDEELERKIVYLERQGTSAPKEGRQGAFHPVLSRPLESHEVLRVVAEVAGAMLAHH